MRLFLAINLSKDIKETALNTITELKLARADVSWLKPENMHITLKFLGETDKSRINGIASLLKEIAGVTRSYKIVTGRLGAFPSKDRPKVIWADLSAGKNETIELSKKIDCELFKAAFKREEKLFNPHVTLGRVRGGENFSKLTEALNTIIFRPIEQQIEEFTLVKSELLRSGVIYKDIETFRLIS